MPPFLRTLAEVIGLFLALMTPFAACFGIAVFAATYPEIATAVFFLFAGLVLMFAIACGRL